MNTTPFGRQTYETWTYEANNLVERYTRSSVIKNQNLATGCYPDTLTAPRDDWRYRYAPFMEREQKRQVELSSGEYQLEGLAWVYYGLGGDKKQLSVWNGVQGTWCLQNNHVFLWPVEYNSYGPMNTRIITRAAGGTKEIVFTDHLGSTVQVRRGTPEYGADQRAYTAFGEDVNLPNEALMGRTGYIGRETDNESALGFYGVRQYDAGYGRFLSVDPLWALYGYVDEQGGKQSGNLMDWSAGQPVPTLDSDNELKVGITIVPKPDGALPKDMKAEAKRFSDDNSIHVYVTPEAGKIDRTRPKGSIGAHEMYSHAAMYIQTKLKVPGVFGWWHDAPQVNERAKEAEKDAKK